MIKQLLLLLPSFLSSSSSSFLPSSREPGEHLGNTWGTPKEHRAAGSRGSCEDTCCQRRQSALSAAGSLAALAIVACKKRMTENNENKKNKYGKKRRW